MNILEDLRYAIDLASESNAETIPKAELVQMLKFICIALEDLNKSSK